MWYYFNFHISEDFLQNFVSLIHFLSHMTECFRTQLDKLTNELQQLFLNCGPSLDLIETLTDFHLISSQMNKQCPCLYSQQVISAFIGSAMCQARVKVLTLNFFMLIAFVFVIT